MEELLAQFGQYGLAGLVIAALLYINIRDAKAFREHLEEDRLREEVRRKQVEEDRDKMIEVLVSNNQVLNDLRTTIQLQDRSNNGRSGGN